MVKNPLSIGKGVQVNLGRNHHFHQKEALTIEKQVSIQIQPRIKRINK